MQAVVMYQINITNPSNTDSTRPIRLVQCSDMHLFADPDSNLLGLNTQQSFTAVLDLISQENPHIDLLINTGDVAQQSQPETYARFLADMQRIQAPYFCIPGNHDLDQAYQQHLKLDVIPTEVVIGNWCCILLNSTMPDEIAGSFSDTTLSYLSQALARQHDKHIIIALHHNPLPVGCDWLDQHMLQTSKAFFDTIAPFKQVKLILHGHVHQQFEQMYRHMDNQDANQTASQTVNQVGNQTVNPTVNPIMCMACPSTSVQFKPNCEKFTLDTVNPGYRWLDLYEDGQFESHVSRLKDHSFVVDYQSNGY